MVKFTIKFLGLFLLFILHINSQEKMDAYQSGAELVKTEYDFAKVTESSTVRDGFLDFIAEEGILFRPGPVNGKEFLENSTANPGILSWYPTASYISTSGKLGINSGPWEFKRTIEEEPVAFGQFLTVWEKQPNGKWKFLIDLGISHPQMAEPKEGIDKSILVEKTKDTKNYNDILEIEENFDRSSAKENYNPIVNNSTTFLRNNRMPIHGKQKDDFLSKLNGTINWETLGGKSSSTNDLAYTYGKGTALDNEMNPVYDFYYLHVWIDNNGSWKLLYDVINEIQMEE